MFDKGKQGVTWEYLRERHVEILSELKTLRDWDAVKAVVPEAEELKDYSLLALQALAALIREFHIEKNVLGERLEKIEQNLDSTRTEMRERDSSLERRIKLLEENVADLQRKMVLVEGVSSLIPRINELEEKLQMGSPEGLARLEKQYARIVEERVNELLNKRLEKIESRVLSSVMGTSTELAKTLKDLQEKYERIVVENYELKKRLKGRDKEVTELKKKLAECDEVDKRLDELQKRVQEYERKAKKLSETEKRLLEITGARNLEEAILNVRKIKSQCVPKSKVAPLIEELKRLREQVEELERENKRLRERNEKLTEALKSLIEKGAEEEEEEE
jgi:DNA repair exonuclease SbcCD ATPase subunit